MKRANLHRFIAATTAVSLIAALLIQVIPLGVAHAATQITTRSLTLEAGALDGGSKPSGTVKHKFTFSLSDTTDALGSINFQYCTTAAAVPSGIGCVAPAGLNITGANLNTQSGATGFTTTTTSTDCDGAPCLSTNVVTIGRGSAATISAGPVSYEFTGIVNPSAANTTFFVRISTYTSLNGTGTALESGTVAASTTNIDSIHLSGTMPESLVFCTGAIISETNSVPDCTTATSGDIDFDRLFSPTDTALATSQMAASTNAGSGYSITVNGTTMTSGSNTINSIATTAQSMYGVSQFGMNLVLDNGTAYTNAPNLTTMPTGMAASADVTPATNATNYNATVGTNYNAGGAHNGTYTYNDGDVVATSNSKGTDSQIYTSSYIVNVPGSQPAGTYTTTLTYICTATY